jgi:hypothetical protein
VKSELVRVERLCPIHVRDGQGDELQPDLAKIVHLPLLLHRSDGSNLARNPVSFCQLDDTGQA